MIEARDVSRTIGENKILDRVSLNLKSGELLVILGPNGAGKSTLLQCLAGVQEFDEGTITLEGKNICDYSLHELAIRRAVLSQSLSMPFLFQVQEIVRMGRHPYDGVPPHINNEIADDMLKRVGAWELRDRSFTTLSGGEQQRVQLARALAQLSEAKQHYLLLDEPTSALDLKHQQQILNLARELAAQGAGVLAILHDLNLAALYADRIALMKQGRVCYIGTPEEVLTEAIISEIFDVNISITHHPKTGRPAVMLS